MMVSKCGFRLGLVTKIVVVLGSLVSNMHGHWYGNMSNNKQSEPLKQAYRKPES